MNIQSPSGPVVRGGFLLFPARCHDSMLTVTDLSKSYGRQTLFDGVSFQVAPGERVGVVGRNGTGKTTLFRILLGGEAAGSGAAGLPGGRGALLLIPHDRDFMDGVTTHTMAIHRGRVRKMSGGTEKLYAQILQEEEIHEQTRVNDGKKRKDAEIFIARFRAQATKARAVQSRIKAPARHERLEKTSDVRNLDFRFTEAFFIGKWMLEVGDLSFGYDARHPLIGKLSFHVAKGDRIGGGGADGGGKTTRRWL